MGLLYHVIRAKEIRLAGKARVEVSHCIYVKGHNPVVRVNEVSLHPLVYLVGVQFKLYHEREQE